MSSAPSSGNSQRRWSTFSLNIGLQDVQQANWGINPRHNDTIIALLRLESFYPDGERRQLRFQHVQLLARYLFDQKITDQDINLAVEKLIAAQSFTQRKAIDDDTNHDKAIQQVLRDMIPAHSPFKLTVDGNWGPQTQRTFDHVVQSFYLPAQTPSRILLARLIIIAERITRIRCSNRSLRNAIPINPFCILDEGNGEFALEKVSNNAYIIQVATNEKLVYLPNLLPEGNNDAALKIFTAFSSWFMLLNVTTPALDSRHGRLGIAVDNPSVFYPRENFINSPLSNKFLISPGLIIEKKGSNNDTARVLFNPMGTQKLRLIGVMFTADFKMLFVQGEEVGGEGAIELSFNLSTLPGIQNSPGQAVGNLLKEGNFIKLFLVSGSFEINLQPAIREESLPAAFFALLSASEAELLATVTIGIAVTATPPAEAEIDFRSKVAALYQQQPVQVQDDPQKRRWGGQPSANGKILKAAVTKKGLGLFKVTLTIEAISGVKWGEVAFFLHDSFSEEIQYDTMIKGKAQITVTAYEAFTVGAYTADGTMLELDLNNVDGYPKNFYYEEVDENFKSTVETLYHEKKVLHSDDLQKGRWRGKPIAKGKILTAEVASSLIPGYYKVTIQLSSENPKNPLKGDTAFFLHDSFSSPIRYRKARDGKASITVTAYEDFTVGAYTEDGTMLELDLHNVKGFPEDFYYDDKKAADEWHNSQSNE